MLKLLSDAFKHHETPSSPPQQTEDEPSKHVLLSSHRADGKDVPLTTRSEGRTSRLGNTYTYTEEGKLSSHSEGKTAKTEKRKKASSPTPQVRQSRLGRTYEKEKDPKETRHAEPLRRQRSLSEGSKRKHDVDELLFSHRSSRLGKSYDEVHPPAKTTYKEVESTSNPLADFMLSCVMCDDSGEDGPKTVAVKQTE